jgi:DNA (cytosine-5)-methyltransferase 1
VHNFNYKWNIKNGYPQGAGIKNGLKVFGTFINGGGSTMGYKLAGFTHLGGVEIDPQVAEIYKENHNPKYLYVQDIREFNKRDDLPDELFDLDLLDGSPPCSTFSTIGDREKAWGKEKVFREGQAKQTLDDLVFVYAETINKLRPKVAILENVKGIIMGNAKAYVKEVNKRLDKYGYNVQIFLLNAATMGVPQRRERVFFICSRKDLNFPKLKLEFSERAIPFGEIKETGLKEGIDGKMGDMWDRCKQGDAFSTITPNANFSRRRLSDAKVCNTITASGGEFFHSTEKRKISDYEIKLIGSYPLDYNFKGIRPMYLIGMSVPPVMMAQISRQIHLQWFDGR